MSLFDNFKSASPVTQQAASASGAPVSANQNPTVPNATNTVVTGATNADGTSVVAATASPLDQFKDLWQPTPNANSTEAFSFNSDPTKLMDAAKSVDFTKVLTPDLQKRVQAGGLDGQNAMIEAMNSVAQMTFAQSSHASAKIVESAVASVEKRFQDMLPSLIKQHTVSDSLRTNNPLMNNPAMAPMVQALQTQFTQKYPQATVTEIQAFVNDYLNGAADMIADGRPKPVVPAKRGEQDWSKFV